MNPSVPSSPIDRLPPELLIAIFKSGCSQRSFKDGGLPFNLLLGTVSRRWRELSRTASQLWTDIYYRLRVPISVIDQSLQLSKHQLLDFQIDISLAVYEDNVVSSLLQVMLSHITRARTFLVVAQTVSDVHTCALGLGDQATPHLRELSIVSLSHFQEGPVSLFQGAGISSLRLSRIGSYPFINLTTLSISWFNPTVAKFRAIFTSSPSLFTLVLSSFLGVDDLDNEEIQDVDASSLRRLAVGFDDDSGTEVCLTSCLVMPNLEYLEVSGVCTRSLPDLFPIERESKGLPRLQTLFLDSIPFSHENITFCRALLSVRHLEIIYDFNTDLEVLTKEYTEEAKGNNNQKCSLDHPFPCLESIKICDTSRFWALQEQHLEWLLRIAVARVSQSASFGKFLVQVPVVPNLDFNPPGNFKDRIIISAAEVPLTGLLSGAERTSDMMAEGGRDVYEFDDYDDEHWVDSDDDQFDYDYAYDDDAIDWDFDWDEDDNEQFDDED